jgi:hypothetical protein
MTSTRVLDSATVLAAARRHRAEADAAERAVLVDALDWARLHLTADPDLAATWGDTPVPLAGDGAPHVSQFAVIELGAVLRMSRRTAEALVGDVVELAYRLPRTWAQVSTGRLKGWKARHVAQATRDLSAEAAGFVDTQVAAFANRISPAELQRLIDTAIAQFMPEHAAEIAAAAAETRDVRIDHQQISFAGTSRIHGELDFLDALDLETALQTGAAQLADLGSDLPLGARRAATQGNLARGNHPLDLGVLDEPARAPRPHREIVLYVHLSEDAITSTGTGTGTALAEYQRRLFTADQIRDWCSTTPKITIKPVREQVILRDRFCPFPYCERNARHGDLDHIEPYDPDRPPGQTTTTNLAGPCRTHHRVKTFSTWTYTILEPGTYLWRSPHGYTFLKDRHGTRDLTPRPLDPPGG